MTAPAASEDRAAWSSAMAATALGAMGVALDGVGGRNVPGIAAWPAVVSTLACAGLLAWLGVRRARPDRRLASIVFIANAASISFAMAMRDPVYARVPGWVPFQANKLACIAAALLAPELWSAFAGIFLHAGASLLVLATLDPTVRARLAFEPLASLAFALVAGVLAVDRQRRLRLERQMAASRAEVVAAERLARTVLAIRNLANTPIQTIELCNELLRSDGRTALHDRIARAVHRLRDLGRLLLEYEASTRWHDDDVSIDAARLLEEGADEARRTTGAGRR